MDKFASTAQIMAGAFAGFSLFFGILAAYVWYRSAVNEYSVSEIKGFLATDEGHLRLAQWLARGSYLNKWAAIWTAISVVAGALSVVFDHSA